MLVEVRGEVSPGPCYQPSSTQAPQVTKSPHQRSRRILISGCLELDIVPVTWGNFNYRSLPTKVKLHEHTNSKSLESRKRVIVSRSVGGCIIIASSQPFFFNLWPKPVCGRENGQFWVSLQNVSQIICIFPSGYSKHQVLGHEDRSIDQQLKECNRKWQVYLLGLERVTIKINTYITFVWKFIQNYCLNFEISPFALEDVYANYITR